MLKTTLKHREEITISTFTIRGGVDNVICEVSDSASGQMWICATLTEAYARIAAQLDNRLISANSHVDALRSMLTEARKANLPTPDQARAHLTAIRNAAH